MIKSPVSLAFGILVACALVACDTKVVKGVKETQGEEAPQISDSFRDAASLKPEVLPPKAANLVLASAEIPVTQKSTVKDGKMTLTWIADDGGKIGEPVVAEVESYMFGSSGFSYAAGPHESFDPPIRLVKYPLTVGDSWEWSGKVATGMTSAKASAKISTSADSLNIPYGNFSALLVTVKMHVETGTEGVNRTFKFWFKPGAGLVARELGQSSSRQPRTEEPDQDKG